MLPGIMDLSNYSLDERKEMYDKDCAARENGQARRNFKGTFVIN